MEFVATCPKGFEHLLADELRSLGAPQVRPLAGQVSFGGALTDAYRACLAAHAGPGVWALCFDGEGARLADLSVPAIEYGAENDGAAQAHRLFTALRELDKAGAKTVYARCPRSDGVSMAVYNRLLRAAAFRILEV